MMTPWLNRAAREKSSARPAATIVRPQGEYRLNEIAETPPSRRQRVGLIAGRSADHLNVGRCADRRRWLGAPLAHEDSARISPTRRRPVGEIRPH